MIFPTKLSPFAAAATILLSSAAAAQSGDWPGFLGPDRDGIADEAIAAHFPGDEPEIAWKRDIGSGFAGPCVAAGKVYLFHRRGDRAVLDAFDAANGKPLWDFSYPTDYRDDFGFDNGPRAVPLVAGGRVFISGAEGMLHAVDAEKGEAIWSVDLREKLGASKGFFGRAPSPLLAGGTLVIQAGGEGAGIIGLDPATGEKKWAATAHEAGYASPITAKVGDRDLALAFTRKGFVCLDPASGEVLVERKHRAAMHASVNAASPVFFAPDRVFLSACYDVGAALWRLDPAAGKVDVVWAEGDRLDCHYATPVPLAGSHLIGFHGRQETGTVLRCIAAATGEVCWTSDRLAAGSVTLAGETLVVLTERGELLLAEANAERFQPVARGQILGDGTRAMPALAGGHLFARDEKRLVCVKLAPAPIGD